MSNLRSFRSTLQRRITAKDDGWIYTVPNLPPPAATNAAELVKVISFISSTTKELAELRMEQCPRNRITQHEPLHLLLMLSVADFRLRENKHQQDDTVRLAPARDSSAYVERLLKTGITLNGTEYHFFGHSNSQLKSRSCFLYAASKAEISTKIEGLGDFSKMKSVGKKVKRIGLLFSSAEMATTLAPDRCEDIDDITKDGFVYTDGCGLISDQLVKRIVQQRSIVHRNKRYLPAVFQIRYRGYKGVLTLSPALRGPVQVQFRESMRKFKDVKDCSFSVVEYSKPYTFGFLNDEIVVLMHSLGISMETLLQKQANYLRFLRSASEGDPQAAFQFLSFQGEVALAEKMLMKGTEAVGKSLRGMVRQEYSKMLNKRDEQRCRIMIPKSRLLFGVCDPTSTDGVTGKLRPGTCFVRITLEGEGEAKTLIGTEVLVTRNPCLHPGDLQKFKVVDVPEWSYLVDCIVFSTGGSRPSADLMSGGDLDGDKFFVTWDAEIIPRVLAEAAEYPGVKERIQFGKILDDQRAEFFAKYNNASLGRVKNLYLDWARIKGPLSPECQQLNRLFSQCVDGDRIKVPEELEDPPKPTSHTPPFVLDLLHDAASKTIEAAIKGDSEFSDYPVDILDLLASRDKVAMSEFELVKLVLRQCHRNNENFDEYAHFFDYSALNDEQQIWLLSRLHAVGHMPSLVRNGLLQSELLHQSELRNFELHRPNLRWQPVFRSNLDRMGRFLNTVSRSLELFHKKLIVLQVDERLTLMVYVPQKVMKANEVKVGASVRIFALPRSSGFDSVNYRVIPTTVNYRLYCDDNVFQLYQTKRKNTFIFLTAGPLDKSTFRSIRSEGDRRRQKQATVESGLNFECRASVALQKISGSIKTHVGRLNRAGLLAAEVYVISNRDVESLHFLDQWLQYVDTEEVLPLFDLDTQVYRVQTLKEIDRNSISAEVAAVVCDEDTSALRAMSKPAQLRETLQLLMDTGQKVRLVSICTELLNPSVCDRSALDRLSTLRTILDFLPQAVVLTEVVLRSPVWTASKDAVIETARATFLPLLKELILEANGLQTFVKEPFLLVLREMKQISVQQLAELVELVALSVGQPEYALDLLVECVGSEATRLLSETPLETQQLLNCLSGVALDYIDQANSAGRLEKYTVKLQPAGHINGFEAVKCKFRIDAVGGCPKTGDHVRFLPSTPPDNAPLTLLKSMDAVVLSSEQSSVTFRCVHHPPSYLSQCTWTFQNRGSFVTSKAMFDAITTFYSRKGDICQLYSKLAGLPREPRAPVYVHETIDGGHNLNESQKRALSMSLQVPLALLWGPPGTGKTHTIVMILVELTKKFNKSRILVTAPTHNAVDNILQRFIDKDAQLVKECEPLRVSTNVSIYPLLNIQALTLVLSRGGNHFQFHIRRRETHVLTKRQLKKVAPNLQRYTCDALFGKDLSEDFAGRRKAQNRVSRSKLVFTTCVGAALGLLRSEEFDIVIIDEASQQTEPETLIPLTKGCQRAILVGDHVQLRATVQKHAVVSGFDVSLFERLYTKTTMAGIAKMMLNTQYRMHSDICSFSSNEFYHGELRTAPALTGIIVPRSQFPWPEKCRKVFVPCASSEDIGRQSKSNHGQVSMCKLICTLLTRPSGIEHISSEDHIDPSLRDGIVILTPYTRQRELLQGALPAYTVSSIDGFQGREAEIVIFVTVRSNAHHDIGFLKDLRRLNVAMTRAKAGVIIVGHRGTLVGRDQDANDMESKVVWERLLDQCAEVELSDTS